ncbi:hypothetical protein ACFE04_018425 [Oxalis oulophora]
MATIGQSWLSSSCFTTLNKSNRLRSNHPSRLVLIIRALKSDNNIENPTTTTTTTTTSTKVDKKPLSSETTTTTKTSSPAPPKKPVYSLKKGQIVRVDKDKYLNSVNYLSVGHPPYYKGLDYIYEDRGEVLDLRIFETGEYALVGWVGIPTAPAWLPTDMLIKSDKLDYVRV